MIKQWYWWLWCRDAKWVTLLRSERKMEAQLPEFTWSRGDCYHVAAKVELAILAGSYHLILLTNVLVIGINISLWMKSRKLNRFLEVERTKVGERFRENTVDVLPVECTLRAAHNGGSGREAIKTTVHLTTRANQTMQVRSSGRYEKCLAVSHATHQKSKWKMIILMVLLIIQFAIKLRMSN